MSSNSQNPLRMIRDPFDGNSFVFPETECTAERGQFFNRMNEIQAFLYTTKLSFDVCKEKYEKIITTLPSRENTPMKLEMNGGNFVIMPASRIVALTEDGINILTRQAFIMFYGSFETYLYQLFERSFPLIGVTEDILKKSRDILMPGNWDGKFCKMNEVFVIGYKASDLTCRFNKFEMNFGGSKYDNPLYFLHELAQVRHRIVHASSILENNEKIFIDMNIFNEFFGFFFHLTDYVDSLFAKKFGYDRKKINSGEA